MGRLPLIQEKCKLPGRTVMPLSHLEVYGSPFYDCVANKFTYQYPKEGMGHSNSNPCPNYFSHTCISIKFLLKIP